MSSYIILGDCEKNVYCISRDSGNFHHLFLVIVAQRDSPVHCVRSFQVNIFPMAGNLPVHRGETFTYRSLKTSHYMQTSFLYKRRLFEKCFVIHSKACFFF